MILINDSFVQIILLFIFSFTLPKQNFNIVFKNKPNKVLKKIIYLIDFFSKSNFTYKSIMFFRNNYPYLSDQKSINKIYSYCSKKFRKCKRDGGQILIENELRVFNWENIVFDEIFNYHFNEKKENKKKVESSEEKIYKLLLKLRNIERLFESRIITFKTSLHYLILLLLKLMKTKLELKKINLIGIKRQKIIESLSIHDFNLKKINQKQDLVINAIYEISKDYDFKGIFQEKDFISYVISSNPDAYDMRFFIKTINITFNLFRDFFVSKKFLEKSSKLIDTFTELFVEKTIFSRNFKVLIIDPVQGPSLPFLSSFLNRGHNVYFTSFSLGSCYTKSCSDYNGTFSKILSPHIGLENLARKSGFNGDIIQTKCYLTMANKVLLKGNKNIKTCKDLNIIIPESVPEWFFALGIKESIDFIEMIYNLHSKSKVNIFFKKKKSYSHIEDHINSNFPNNNFKFLPPIRGLMVDFFNKDYIISSGISSLGIKASEIFNVPYIIFDPNDNSKNEWNNIYFNAKLKPKFANNLAEVNKIIKQSQKY